MLCFYPMWNLQPNINVPKTMVLNDFLACDTSQISANPRDSFSF